MLERTLEPEVMDSPGDAREYDSMDHREVNALFVTDFLAAAPDTTLVLDLGTGTAQIPIELCRRDARARVVAIDMAESMLAVGRANIRAAGLADRIDLALADAKSLPYPDAHFTAVISNSIIHHVAEPTLVLAEAVRVLRPGGTAFFRDLCRPVDEASLARLVTAYAGNARPRQRRLFADSLRAALTLAEVQCLVTAHGYPSQGAAVTSDRHWTWCGRKPA